MPNYKRKKRNTFSQKPKQNKKYLVQNKRKNETKYTDDEPKTRKKRGLKVVKGKKIENQKRFRSALIVSFALIFFLVCCEFFIPAGLFETAKNLMAGVGAGSFPIDFESSNTRNVVAKFGYYYVLTDGQVKTVNNNGKVLFSYDHGFENPVIKTSQTRAILFDQGGTSAIIFNLGKIKSKINSKKEIINAAIGDDGTYALVTETDGYVAAVSVYKKNDKLLYEWYSANDIVNNVAVAPNGKKIAVSTLVPNVSGFNSKLMILNFKSPNAEFTKQYDGQVIYSLSTDLIRGVSVITANNFDFIKWSNYKSKQHTNDYNLQIMRGYRNGILLVYNRENDKTDNRIVLITKRGDIKYSISFDGIITDIDYRNNHIYCISDTKAYILDKDGKIIRTADCGFGTVRLAVISQNEIAVITDTQIGKVKFEQR